MIDDAALPLGHRGHQHFLDRLAAVPRIEAPPPRGRGKKAVTLTAAETIEEDGLLCADNIDR